MHRTNIHISKSMVHKHTKINKHIQTYISCTGSQGMRIGTMQSHSNICIISYLTPLWWQDTHRPEGGTCWTRWCDWGSSCTETKRGGTKYRKLCSLCQTSVLNLVQKQKSPQMKDMILFSLKLACSKQKLQWRDPPGTQKEHTHTIITSSFFLSVILSYCIHVHYSMNTIPQSVQSKKFYDNSL